MIGTFVLMLGVLYIASPTSSLGALDALPVGLLGAGDPGLSLGGPHRLYCHQSGPGPGPPDHTCYFAYSGERGSDWGVCLGSRWQGPVSGRCWRPLCTRYCEAARDIVIVGEGDR